MLLLKKCNRNYPTPARPLYVRRQIWMAHSQPFATAKTSTMKKSILAALAVILIAILCYMLYNFGKSEGESIKKALIEGRSGKNNEEDGNKGR